MQPPPQPLPPGTGGPPPPMGMGPNANRRNNPYSKRGNVQVSGASTSVQPVTDPFAFGRLTPQNTLLNNTPRGNPLVRHGASLPAYSQPVSTHTSYAGEYSHGAYTSSSVFGGGSQAVHASSSRGGAGSQEVPLSSPQPGAELAGAYTMTLGPAPGLLGGNMSSGSVPGLLGGYTAAGSGPGAAGGYTSGSGPGVSGGFTSSGPSVPGVYTPLGSGSGPGLPGGYTSGFGPDLHGSCTSSPSRPGLPGALTSSATGAGLLGGYPSAGLGPDLHGGYTTLVSAPRSIESHRSSRSDPSSYRENTSSAVPGTGSDGVCTSSSGSGANICPSTNAMTTSGLTGYFTKSSVTHPSTKPPPQNASALPYSSSNAFESSFREHQQAGSPNQDRPQSRQNDIRDLSTSSSIVTNATPFHPSQKPTAQWRPMQDGLQMTVSHGLPPTVPFSTTVPSSLSQSYSSLNSGSYSLPIKTFSPSHSGQGQQSAPFTSLAVGAERNSISALSQGRSLQLNHSFEAEYNYKQNVGPSSNFSAQPYTEHFYQQPLLSDGNREELVPSVQTPEKHLHAESESAAFQVPADSGTISMFFKGSEAENEEIVSSERQEGYHGANSDSTSQYCSGQTYISPLYSQPHATNVPSQAPIAAVSNETAQMGIEQYFSLSVSKQDDNQSGRHPDIYDNDQRDSSTANGQQFDTVENMECVQNQEVPPSESLDTNTPSASTSTDIFRYGPLPGPPLRNNSIEVQAEAGPNLETPDSVSHPVRSDSVSSGYSNVSHRSASSSTRPQELINTFIQQESGKPDESPASFFKQIDSSSMDVDSSRQNPTKDNVHASLSQAPTPSPPKPTGIFQTSANSSFEPVRAHGVGVKPAEVDQAKMVGEVRESHTVQSKTRHSTTMPATSPGNLEQPPDNLETIFTPQAHPFNTHGIGDPGNLLQPLGVPSLDSTFLSLEKRPSSRAHGASKKCESPATTLWAQSELPIFGANVLLAPAAPAVHVPPKPRGKEIIQPPEVGLLDLKTNLIGPDPERTSLEGNTSSENLENPPKIGEEEPLNSQASSGYASLLSSPPTDSLQNQPLLIAHPSQICHFPQPINFSMSLPNQLSKHENTYPLKVEDSKSSTSQTSHSDSMSGENALSALRGASVTNQFLCTNTSNANLFPSTNPSQPVSSKASNLVVQPPSQQIPLNLATSTQTKIKEEYVLPEPIANPRVPSSNDIGTNLSAGNDHLLFTAPAKPKELNSGSSTDRSNSQEETSGALDFTMSRVQSAHNFFPAQTNTIMGDPAFTPQFIHTSAEINDKPSFYRQVTNDKHPQSEHKESFHSAPHVVPDSHIPKLSDQPAAASYQMPFGNISDHDSTEKETRVNSSKPPSDVPSQGRTSEPPAAYDPAGPEAGRSQSSSTPAVSIDTKDSGQQQEQHIPAIPQMSQQGFGPAVDSSAYMYYRQPYDAYQSAYPSAYNAQDPRAAYAGADPRSTYPAPDPRTSHLYYQDVYGAYDPRYRPYDATNAAYMDQGRYRYVEPERPSSRCSRTSDRPSSRQGYGEDYGNTKAGWSAPSDYYGYYPSHYDYGDPSRWDPYHPGFDPRSRDPRRYWSDMEQDPYHRNEAYPYSNRQGGADDPWQYDPRFDRSFDNEPEPSRGPYGDDFDRRSIHSEHSVHSVHSSHSVHSRRSSFSSQSQHSQVYRSQPDLTANAYDASAQPSSLHSDYAYGLYPGNFNNQPSTVDYSYGYPSDASWPGVEQVPARPMTPEKFSVPHVCARFGPGGHFLKVLPNLPSEGQPALVEVHSMEVMLQHTPDQEEMRAFPGPLLKDETHKVDVINYAQNKATKCFQDENLIDQESSSLLWDFIVLLCRQNGTVVGTDLAELLLQDHKTVWLPGKSPNEANLIDFNNEPLEQEEESVASQLSFLTDVASGPVDSIEKETERFRELLLYGRKKDALESAMKHALWGHALLLASKMDSRTHARVMTRFANSLPINDPLQTVYQLMSGRMPAASTCCGDEKWGDWRPHLAMVLSNLTNNLEVETRTITTMGDTLASRGLLDASHFCYLMAQVGFGVYTKKTTKLVLIGSNHSWPFLKFSSNKAIHRTEAYEYAQSLGTQPCSLPNFQVFKFIYACRLAELGLAAQAFHYCEVIAKTILKHPSYYSAVLITQLIEISSQLRFFDPQLKEKPEQELFVEPVWLVRLRHLDGQIKHGTIIYNSDRATPQQYACSTSSSEVDHISHPDSTGVAQEVGASNENPLLATLMPNMMPAVQEVQLVLPDSQAILERPPPHLQQQLTSNEPSLSFMPGTGFAPPLQNQGFVPTYGIEQMHTYPVPSGESAFPASPIGESMTELQWNQDPGMRRFSQDSPSKKTFHETGFDYSGSVGKVAPGYRSRTTSQSSAWMASGQRSRNASQSSMRMVYGGRSRTTSESSTHSMGSGRRNSATKQPSPPPIPEFDGNKRKTGKESKAESSQSSGRSWFPLKFGWLMGRGKNEAHLPDDTNRSIVWDEKKKRWVNMDEPEGEELKPPPPPPPGVPKGSQSAPSGPGGPLNSNVNMFSIRAAGARGRYVDVLNPSGTRSGNSVPPPADLFAPLAPMSIPANLFVPNAVPEEQQPAEGNEAEQVAPTHETSPEHHTETQHSSQIPSGFELPVSNADGNHSGELSRSSSMSSLSREVSQHLNQSSNIPVLPSGAVQFYNPSQFTQPSASSMGSRRGRFGQRKYPTTK